MAFNEHVVINKPSIQSQTGVNAALRKFKAGPAKLALTCSTEFQRSVEWSDDQPLRLLVGVDNDHGLLRLVPDKGGSAIFKRRESTRGTWFNISLGVVPGMPDRAEPKRQCEWEILDDGSIEIVLPSWIDEMRPKGVSIDGEHPSNRAAKREAERIVSEKAEAAERRRVRALREEREERGRQGNGG
ncbi:MAG: hypothetical protein AAFW47_07165 [Pseudomonadota bacterium]